MMKPMLATDQLVDHQVTYGATPELQELVRGRTKAGQPTVSIDRTLESVYFDADGLPLYRQGAMLRERGRSGRSKRTTEAKLPSESGLLRLKGDAARLAASDLAGGRDLGPVATQTKHRRLLLVPGTRSRFAPDFVIALDRATVNASGVDQPDRFEIELQLFTALPWTSSVDSDRLRRFHDFCRTCEADFGLVPSPTNGYQAIPEELLA